MLYFGWLYYVCVFGEGAFKFIQTCNGEQKQKSMSNLLWDIFIKFLELIELFQVVLIGFFSLHKDKNSLDF